VRLTLLTLKAALIRLAALAALGPAAFSAGCVSETSTRVEQGQPVSTGDATYDAFFKQVDELRAEATKAEKDVAEARAALLKALELPAETGSDATIKAAGERAKKLKDGGVLLHLELTPEAKLISTRSKGIDPWSETLIKAVEDSAKGTLSLVQRLRAIDGRSLELQTKRRELRAKTKEVFGDRAEEIERELDATEQTIATAGDLGAKQAGSASYFVLGLASAVETGARGAQPATRVATGRGKPPGKAGRPIKTSGGKAGPTSPASAPPAAKPKPKGDDFEP
jgi:hypothetical protein